MNDELRESRGALILLAAVVLSVLIFGAVTLLGLTGTEAPSGG
jgi:hypothetical protein